MKKNKSKSLKDLFSMKNKKVLIIGGAGYLGKAMTLSLMELGASIVVSSRNKKKGELVIVKIKKNNNKDIVFHPVDITNQVSINKLKDFVSKKFNNQLDVLINCGWSGKKNTFESINNEDWQYDIETCLTGVFKTTKIFLPLLKKKEGIF